MKHTRIASIKYIDKKLNRHDPYEIFHTVDSDHVGNFLCVPLISKRETQSWSSSTRSFTRDRQTYVDCDGHRVHWRNLHTYTRYTTTFQHHPLSKIPRRTSNQVIFVFSLNF